MNPEDDYGQLDELKADLEALVEAGLVDEVREPGEASRYGLSPLGVMLAAAIKDDRGAGVAPSATAHGPWPMGRAPCPVCGATDGVDGVAQCLHCSPSTSSSMR